MSVGILLFFTYNSIIQPSTDNFKIFDLKDRNTQCTSVYLDVYPCNINNVQGGVYCAPLNEVGGLVNLCADNNFNFGYLSPAHPHEYKFYQINRVGATNPDQKKIAGM